ncbi:hypothetical protein ABZS94_40435 [Streptomyces sp. NPDC005500]|uniref:hypothetical protein n=1 Tax=Streptomyces sp. NPDC005500 TaxID=3155007 RepID=UPI00339EBAD1
MPARQIFLAHHAVGDIDALREAAARLAHINEQLGGGVDMEYGGAVYDTLQDGDA